MRRKIVLTVLLCLATALAIGAAPALAASGCTCHTADPPTAPAAHAPLVLGVTDCTTCHKGITVPHPELVVPSLTLTKAESGLLGRFVVKGKGINGVVVYLQQRLWGETAFTDLTQVTTQTRIMGSTSGWFYFPVPHPTPWAAYRAVSEGVAGPPVVVPGKRVWLPKPELTVEIRGIGGGWGEYPTTRLGRTLTVRGTVAPADLGGKVTIRVQKRVNHRWVNHVRVKRAISATGTYSWKWTPSHRGKYRVFVAVPATDTHRGIVVRWRGVGTWRTFAVL